MHKIFFLISIIAFKPCNAMDQDYEVIGKSNKKNVQYYEETKKELNDIQESIHNLEVRLNKFNEKMIKHKKNHKDSIISLQQQYTYLDEKTNKQNENIKTLANEIFTISGSFDQILDDIIKSKKDHEEGVKSVASALNEKINKTNENVTKIDTGVGTIVKTLGKMQNEISKIFFLWECEVKRNDKNEQKINDFDSRMSNVEGMIKKLCSSVTFNIYFLASYLREKNYPDRTELRNKMKILKEYVLENKELEKIFYIDEV